MIILLSFTSVLFCVFTFIYRAKWKQAEYESGLLNCQVIGLQSDIFYERNKRREHATEIKEIIMDDRMRRIARGKRKPTEADIKWARTHRPPAPPSPPKTRVVVENGKMHKEEDNSLSMVYPLVVAAPINSGDSGSSSGAGGSCDYSLGRTLLP